MSRDTKLGFHNRGVRWDTPMKRWAGEGKDWIQLMTQTQPRKEDVIWNLLKLMKQPVEKKGIQKICADKETEGSASPQIWTDTGKSKGTIKQIVDWMNGQTRIGTVEKAQNPPSGMVGSRDALTAACNLGHPHLSWTTTKKLTHGVGKGTQGRVEEWFLGY